VTALLGAGANVLGVELGRGWYGMTEPSEWYWHMAPWHAQPALLAQLEVQLADGRRVVVATWQLAQRRRSDLHDSVFGASATTRGACCAAGTAPLRRQRLAAASAVPGPPGQLHAAAQPPIGVTGTLQPVAVTQPRPGIYVFDFGRIFCRPPAPELSGPAGTTVSLVQTEKLNADGTVAVASGLVDTQLQTSSTPWRGRYGVLGARVRLPRFRYVQSATIRASPASRRCAAS